jgi:hypothetical protein
MVTAGIVTGLNYEKKHGDPITTCFPYNLSLPGGEKRKYKYIFVRNHVSVARALITYNSESFQSS